MLAFVQQNSAAGANLCAFPGNVSVGDLLIVSGLYGGGFTNITDSLGNPNYTVVTSRVGGNGLTSFLAYCYSQFAGPCTVHINGSPSNYFGILEYSGLKNGTAPLVFNTDGGNSALADCGGLVTPSANTLILMTGQIWTTGSAFTPSAGFTKRVDTNTVAIADSFINPAGANNPTLTLAVGQPWNGIGVAFQSFLPPQNLTPQVSQILMTGYTIEPIEEE